MDIRTMIDDMEREIAELQSAVKVLKARAAKALGVRASLAGGAVKAHGRVWSPAARRKMSRLIKASLAKKKASRKGARKPKQAPKAQPQS